MATAKPKAKRPPGRPKKAVAKNPSVSKRIEEALNSTPEEMRFTRFEFSIQIGSNERPINLKSDSIQDMVDLFDILGDEEAALMRNVQATFDLWQPTTPPGMTVGFVVGLGNITIKVSGQNRAD